MPASVMLDLSELISHPLRSGIQRVEREAIRYWPGPADLLPCLVNRQGQLLQLPHSVMDILCAKDGEAVDSLQTEREAFAELAANARPVDIKNTDRLLNLELFFDPIRAGLHLRLAATGVRVLWYLYDFLPFLRPDLFQPGTTRHCMHFLRGLRAASSLAFLSEQTRQDYLRRIARVSRFHEGGPVILPGADGLQLERQQFSLDRHDFVAIGTVEPRKNTIALLVAFESLWNAGLSARLIVVGRISPEAVEARAFFARHAENECLVVMDQPGDETLRAVLRRARAVVMPSEAEGFGLPPYEALYSGIPAIASARLPSAALLPRGTKLLERMDAASIAGAVASLLDDAIITRLWNDAASVSLPTWAAFGREFGGWAQEA